MSQADIPQKILLSPEQIKTIEQVLASVNCGAIIIIDSKNEFKVMSAGITHPHAIGLCSAAEALFRSQVISNNTIVPRNSDKMEEPCPKQPKPQKSPKSKKSQNPSPNLPE